MMPHDEHSEPVGGHPGSSAEDLPWKWMVLAVTIGLMISGTSFFIITPLLSNEPVELLVMLAGFVILGLIIGYFSEGMIVRDAGLSAGMLILVLAGLLVLDGRMQVLDRGTLLYWSTLNIGGGILGGWIGRRRMAEIGDAVEKTHVYVRFPWRPVLLGIGVSLSFSIVFLFVFFPLFKINENVLHVGFLIGFFAGGVLLGYRSDRMRMSDPGVAGTLLVVANGVLLMIATTTRLSVLLVSLLLGFLLVFGGAWFGERFRPVMSRPGS